MTNITGTAGNDTLTGTSPADLIEGLSGDDALLGGAGNDILNGGTGHDTAVYAGVAEDYVLATGVSASGGFTVADGNIANGDDGTDIVAGIERLQFADATVDVAWAASQEFRVNTTAAGWQFGPSVSALGDGGFVVAWTAVGAAGRGYEVAGQRYDASGTAVGSEFSINGTTSGDQADASVAGLADGGFVVTWTSNGQDGSGLGVYGQRYGAGGGAAGSEFRANTTSSGDQAEASVATLADGGYVVAWSGNGPTDNLGIYGQRYSAAGAPLGTEFRVNATIAGDQYSSAVAALASGG